jgi:hypothetical protein
MTVDRGFVEQNDRERARLQALAARVSDADLAQPMAAGWTVAGVLGHLAFWDQRTLVLLERWENAGLDRAPHPMNGADVNWINDAAKALCLALPPRRAADLSLAVAEAVDRKIETIPDEFVTRNVGAGRPINFLRAEHRREHLDEIEAELGRS